MYMSMSFCSITFHVLTFSHSHVFSNDDSTSILKNISRRPSCDIVARLHFKMAFVLNSGGKSI